MRILQKSGRNSVPLAVVVFAVIVEDFAMASLNGCCPVYIGYLRRIPDSENCCTILIRCNKVA
jgi:hypothetical protein